MKKRTYIRIRKKNLPYFEHLAENKVKQSVIDKILQKIAYGDYDHMEKEISETTVPISADQEMAKKAKIVARELGFGSLSEMVDLILTEGREQELY